MNVARFAHNIAEIIELKRWRMSQENQRNLIPFYLLQCCKQSEIRSKFYAFLSLVCPSKNFSNIGNCICKVNCVKKENRKKVYKVFKSLKKGFAKRKKNCVKKHDKRGGKTV